MNNKTPLLKKECFTVFGAKDYNNNMVTKHHLIIDKIIPGLMEACINNLTTTVCKIYVRKNGATALQINITPLPVTMNRKMKKPTVKLIFPGSK